MHNVEAINPKDDAFHKSRRLSAEWWYFDGVFSDDYSFHIGIRTFSTKKKGRAILIFELYQKDKIIFEKKKRFPLTQFSTSDQYPHASIMNSPVLYFDNESYEKKGDWKYHINMDIDECSADLLFNNLTQGFKVETKKESWTVALPKAKVTGQIHYNKEILPVDGIGYHDHNWNYTLSSALTYGKGWYWGKIKSNTYTIVWANVMKRSGFHDILAIVNLDGNGFFNIDPKNVIFRSGNYIKYHRRKIPSHIQFSFKENKENKPIEANVTMDVKHVHFSKVLFSSYWRYHVHIKGYVSIDNKKEYIDNIQIMEYLSIF